MNITLGKAPAGIVIESWRKKKAGDAEVLAYIQSRSGEYDEREKDVLSDPYVEGWDAFHVGWDLDALIKRLGKGKPWRKAYRENWESLLRRGYKDARADREQRMKS